MLESVISAIANALENDNVDRAHDIMDYWDASFPLEGEGRSLFLFWNAKVYIYELEKYESMKKDINERMLLMLFLEAYQKSIGVLNKPNFKH